MKPHFVRIVLPVLAAGVLQAQVSAPRIGIIRCSDGMLHAVYGLAANFVLATKPFAPADTASFSDRAGLIANNGTIQLVTPGGAIEAEYQSRETAPLLNVDTDSSSAIAWLPVAQGILRWAGSAFRFYPVSPGAVQGQVTAIRSVGQDRAELLLLNPDGSTSRAAIALSTGNLVSLDIIPGVRGPVFAQQTALVFRDGQGLAIETADGVRHTLPISRDIAPAT